MSKKHFEFAANEIRKMRANATYLTASGQKAEADKAWGMAIGAYDVMVRLAVESNPRFDAARFERACQP